MATSLHSGFVAFGTTLAAADRPVDTALAQTVWNNVNHLADQCGQVRVSWVARTGEYLEPDTGFSANTYYRLAAFGPFPLTVNYTGESYRMRVRVAGHSQSNTKSSTFRVVLSAPSEAASFGGVGTTGLSNVMIATTTSSTVAWLSPSDDNLVYLTADQCRAGGTTIQTLTAVGGNATAVQVQYAHLEVWAASETVSSAPRLDGLYAAEYLAP